VKRHMRLYALGALTCVITLILSAGAAGRTYLVYSCGLPNGERAPAPGWRISGPTTGARHDISCADGNGLSVVMVGDVPYPMGWGTGIALMSPPDVSIVSARAQWRRGASGNRSETGPRWMAYAGTFRSTTGGEDWDGINVCGGTPECGEKPDQYTPIYGHGFPSRVRGLRWGVMCGSYMAPCPLGSTARVAISSLELTAEDRHKPVLSAPLSGSLLDPNDFSSVRSIRFSAHDRGSGLRRAVLQVGTRVIATRDFATPDAPCKLPYTAFRPCPSRAAGEFRLDSAGLAPGVHHGAIVLYDATNGAPARYSFSFVVLGPGETSASVALCDPTTPLNVAPIKRSVSFWAPEARFRLADSTWSSLKVLTDQAAPFHRVLGVTTHHGSTHRVKLRRGPSRMLRLAVPKPPGGLLHSCSQPLSVVVRAGVRMRVRPRRVSNGGTIRFAGRVYGGTLAAKRPLEVQVRTRGSKRPWLSVRTLTTLPNGRFKMRYTFRRTTQRVRFAFRAISRPDPGFPFAPGTSQREFVLVTGSGG
jgi:hypothetical protein